MKKSRSSATRRDRTTHRLQAGNLASDRRDVAQEVFVCQHARRPRQSDFRKPLQDCVRLGTHGRVRAGLRRCIDNWSCSVGTGRPLLSRARSAWRSSTATAPGTARLSRGRWAVHLLLMRPSYECGAEAVGRSKECCQSPAKRTRSLTLPLRAVSCSRALATGLDVRLLA